MATTAGSTRINIDLALNTRGFRPLGRINGQLGEFEKSLDASNARVLAFGASAGAILAVRKAFTATVKSAIEVEKSLKDINVILQATSTNLQKFGSDLFKIASDTGQSFKVAAEAATELARQGLGVEETLKRTKDALILARLAGMDAADAVNALTAALNTFTKVGLDSTTIINKLANVDAAFAVSSEDLAKALGRVGSAAVSAGVDLDQLLAIVTTAQQKTARGGAVIGNSFKTIFTRIQRPRVIKELENLGIQVRGLQGDTLPAIRVLENLAKQFDNLSQSQRAQISELVGGVFQVNVLKAALSDLSREQGIYNRALGISIGSSDQAIRRNEELNETLAAQFQRTINTFKEAAAEIGGLTFGPALENIFGTINKTFDAASGDGSLAKAGQAIAKSVFEGIGKFIGGPGIIIVGALLIKTFAQLATFAADAFKTLAGLNRNLQNQLNIQKQIFGVLSENPDLMNRIRNGTLSVEDAHELVLQRINQETAALDNQLIVSQRIAASLTGAGVAFSPDFGATSGGERNFGRRGRRGRSGGYVPNFAEEEVLGMMMGGYSSSQLANPKVRRDTIHNGRGGAFSAMTNGHESVVDFTNSMGKKATAVIPPKGSEAFKDFMGALSGGYIPNFKNFTIGGRDYTGAGLSQAIKRGDVSKADAKEAGYVSTADAAKARARKKARAEKAKFQNTFDLGGRFGGLALFGESNQASSIEVSTGGITPFKGKKGIPPKLYFTGFQSKSFLGEVQDKDDRNLFSGLVKKHMAKPMERVTNDFAKSMGLQDDAPVVKATNIGRRGNALFPPGAEGSIFETAINAMTKNAKSFEAGLAGDTSALWDFEESGNVNSRFKKKFGYSGALKRADAKRTLSQEALNSIGNKIVSTLTTKSGQALDNSALAQTMAQYASGPLMKKKGKAGGFIPSFSALHQAVARERSAGVPMNRIRVGSSRSLASGINPMGLGVYNTQDEPGGLGQGIRRSLSMGTNPKSAGSVPNFANGDDNRSLASNTATLIGVTVGLQLLTDALRSNTESEEKASSKVSVVAESLQKALLVGGAVATAGSFLPRGVNNAMGRNLGSFMPAGGSDGGRTRSFANRSQRINFRSGFNRRRDVIAPTLFGRGSIIDSEQNTTRGPIGPVPASGRRITREIRTRSLAGQALRRGGRAIGRAGRRIRGGISGMGVGGVLGSAGGAFVGAAAIGDSRLFDNTTKEFEEAGRAMATIAQEVEQNIGKLTKFGDATEQAIATFNDTSATMAQVNQAQEQLNNALKDLPASLRKQVSGLADPAAIQGAIADAIAQQQTRKEDAQFRSDSAGFAQRNDRKFLDVLGNLERIFMSEFEAGRQSEARQREFDNISGRLFNTDQFTQGVEGNTERFNKDLNVFNQILGNIISNPGTLSSGFGGDINADKTTKRLQELGKSIGIADERLDALIKTLKTGGDAAKDAAQSTADTVTASAESIKVIQNESKVRGEIQKLNLRDARIIKRVQEGLLLEEKTRKELIKINSQAANAVLSDTGRIRLNAGLKNADNVRANLSTFGASLSGAQTAFGSAGSLRGTALGSQVQGFLARAGAGGIGSVDSQQTALLSKALTDASAEANSQDAKALEALAIQLEQLNSTSDRLATLSKDQLNNLIKTTRAQQNAARQGRNIKAFGGVAALTDPSSLNNVFAQLQGAQQAGAIASRAGSRLGVDRANVNRFQAIQGLLGGSLEGTEFLKPAQDAARRVSFNQASSINRALGSPFSRERLMDIANTQAANAFKGTPEEQLNKGILTLDSTIKDLDTSFKQAMRGSGLIAGLQQNAQIDRQGRYADFAQTGTLNDFGQSFGEKMRMNNMLAQKDVLLQQNLQRAVSGTNSQYDENNVMRTREYMVADARRDIRYNREAMARNMQGMTTNNNQQAINIFIQGSRMRNSAFEKAIQQAVKNDSTLGPIVNKYSGQGL